MIFKKLFIMVCFGTLVGGVLIGCGNETENKKASLSHNPEAKVQTWRIVKTDKGEVEIPIKQKK